MINVWIMVMAVHNAFMTLGIALGLAAQLFLASAQAQ